MHKIFEKPYDIKLPTPHKEEAEFGKAKSGLGMCRSCLSFYYAKSWHLKCPIFPTETKNREIQVELSLCPACRMIRNKVYEGRLIIRNVPARSIPELESLIRSYGARAYNKDCQHRLINLSRTKNHLEVTTTENQLATRLAKKIKDAFNRVRIRTIYSAAPSDASLVRVEFLSV